MKKKLIAEIDCANCAAKMEAEIQEIPGVLNASVNFLLQKITIEADEKCFDEILQKAIATCKKVEPDCQIFA